MPGRARRSGAAAPLGGDGRGRLPAPGAAPVQHDLNAGGRPPLPRLCPPWYG